MRRRSRMHAGHVLALVLLAACACERPSASSTARTSGLPDVVLVSIDSLRQDHLGCYGYPQPTSPTIDRLAREGVLFQEAVSTTSWTLPAHAALFTGLYDSTHGLDFDGLRLADAHVTLAEVMRQAGWTTAGFFGGPYLHPSFGLGQGFDTYQSCMTKIAADLPELELRRQAFQGAGSHGDVTGPRLLEEVTRWADDAGGGPWFLFLHFWDVHYDYLAPQSYVELFDPGYEGEITGKGFMRDPRIEPGMSARDRAHLMALYDAEIRFTDDILSQVLALLERLGRTSNLLLVVTADHGEEFFEHGAKGHRRTLFDEVLRIPLVVHWPGHVPAGGVVEQQVRLVDVMPTILDLVGIDAAAAGVRTEGRSLAPLLRGETLPPAPALAELRRLRGPRLRALRTDHRKLIERGRRQHLYDLDADPGERMPLEPTPALRQALAEAVEGSRRLRSELGEREAVATAIEPDVRVRLEALGYLEGEASDAEPDAAPD